MCREHGESNEAFPRPILRTIYLTFDKQTENEKNIK